MGLNFSILGHAKHVTSSDNLNVFFFFFFPRTQIILPVSPYCHRQSKKKKDSSVLTQCIHQLGMRNELGTSNNTLKRLIRQNIIS